MIILYILAFVWLILALIALSFARKAGEDEWMPFVLINLIPLAGSVLSILSYAKIIGEKEQSNQINKTI